jgi:hypothetical protein
VLQAIFARLSNFADFRVASYTYLSVDSQHSKEHRYVMEDSQAPPACPSDTSSVKPKVSVEQHKNDTDREKPKFSERNLSQYQVVEQKFQIN